MATAENASYPSGIDVGTYGPTSAGDPTVDWEYIPNTRQILENTFANVAGAVTASHTELNYLDITTLGTAAASKAITVDGSANCNCSAVTFTNLGAVTTVDINGGTLDGVVIGGSSAAAVSATTLAASGNATVGGTLAVTGAATAASLQLGGAGATPTEFSTDDTMAGDSDTAIPTEQAVKGYVDASTYTYRIDAVIADVSTAETVLIPINKAGTILRVDSVLEGAITVADATVTLVQSNENAIASLTIAYSGSTTGDMDSDQAPSNAAVTAGSYLKLETDGGSSTAQRLWVTILVQATLN